MSEPRPRLFSISDYYRMAEAEILGPDERTELVEGQIICKVRPMTPPLAVANGKSKDALREVFNGSMVAANFPLRLSDMTELEPDILVAPGCPDDYIEQGPSPAQVALVVELADGPNGFDQQWKARLYAESGIVDYWFVSVTERTLEVRRQPENGQYQEVTVYKENEAVAPLAAPHASVRVASLLPKLRTLPADS